MRAPLPTGSLVDFVVTVGRDTTVDEVNQAFRDAARGLSTAPAVLEDPLVSTDIVHSGLLLHLRQCLVTMVTGRNVKVFGWYDNEWGYSCRLVDPDRQAALMTFSQVEWGGRVAYLRYPSGNLLELVQELPSSE